jgi:hypothetical protein
MKTALNQKGYGECVKILQVLNISSIFEEAVCFRGLESKKINK